MNNYFVDEEENALDTLEGILFEQGKRIVFVHVSGGSEFKRRLLQLLKHRMSKVSPGWIGGFHRDCVIFRGNVVFVTDKFIDLFSNASVVTDHVSYVPKFLTKQDVCSPAKASQ